MNRSVTASRQQRTEDSSTPFVRLVHTVLSGGTSGPIARMYEAIRRQTPTCVVAIASVQDRSNV